MKFSDDFIEKLRESNDILDLIGRHTVLKSSGRSHMGLCPFPDHQEKSPSFSVSQDKQLYHCFGCGKSGNIYSFLRDYYGYSFPESIEFLAKIAGIPMPERTQEEVKSTDRKKVYTSILNFTMEHFNKNLKELGENHQVFKYLQSREMSDSKIIENIKIGWAKDSWDDLVRALQSEGLSLEAASEQGLVKKKKSGQGYFDGFRARVMFPVFSFSGEVVGFGGRVLGDEKPKYINSPESSVFKKGKIFYGQNWASPYIRQEDEVVLVEGYTDWISLFKKGIKNVLATMGTSLTESHGRKISNWCSKALCLFDGDEAGAKASERALINLLPAGLLVRGVFLPKGEDPDSFIKLNGLEKTKKILKNSEDLFLQLLDAKLRGFSGKPHEKVETLKWVGFILSHLSKESSLMSLYIQEVDSRLNLGAGTIKQEILKALKDSSVGPSESQKPTPKKPVKPYNDDNSKKVVRIGYKKNHPEYILFSLAIANKPLLEEALKEEISFTDPGTDFLWSLSADKYRQNRQKSVNIEAYLASFCANPEALTLTLEKPYSQLNEEQIKDIFHECLAKVKRNNMKSESQKMRKKMGPSSDEEDLKRFMELQRKKRDL